MIIIIAIVTIITAFGFYLLAWSRRMMPLKAEICDAVKSDGGEIVNINDFRLWVKILGEGTVGTPIVLFMVEWD